MSERLTDQQLKAMDLKLANPHLSWAEISRRVDISERQLLRWRESEVWKDEWERRDKQDMIDALRVQAIQEGNAALYKLYFEVTGTLDEEMFARMLKMSEEEAIQIGRDAARWFLSTREGIAENSRASQVGNMEGA